MATWLILLIGVEYFICTVDQMIKGNYWLALIYFCYSVSTVGMYKLG